jgi:hypothetical protein
VPKTSAGGYARPPSNPLAPSPSPTGENDAAQSLSGLVTGAISGASTFVKQVAQDFAPDRRREQQAVSLLQAAKRNLEASVNRYPDDARLTTALSQVENAMRLLAGTQGAGDL